jgi:hypothetical protein
VLPIEFKEQIYAHYRDESGQITIDRDPTPNSTGNGLLHYGLFITMLKELGIAQIDDIEALEMLVDKCTVRGADGKPIYGLVHRSLWKTTELEGPDDYYGLLAASFHSDNDFAEKFVEYFEENNGVINNLNPGVLTNPNVWFDRMPGFAVFARICATKKSGRVVSIYEKAILATVLLASSFGKASDAHVKEYLQLTVARKVCPLLFWPVWWVWSWRTKKTFGSISGSFEDYFKGSPFCQVELK